MLYLEKLGGKTALIQKTNASKRLLHNSPRIVVFDVVVNKNLPTNLSRKFPFLKSIYVADKQVSSPVNELGGCWWKVRKGK